MIPGSYVMTLREVIASPGDVYVYVKELSGNVRVVKGHLATFDLDTELVVYKDADGMHIEGVVVR